MDRITLHFTGRAATAAATLVTRSALVHVLEEHGGLDIRPGNISYWLRANAVPMLSSGEYLLWQLLASMSGRGDTVNIYELANRIDEESSAAVADALGVLLGQVVAA